MKNQAIISITKLTEQVNAGMRKKEIAEFYNIPEFQVGKLLKQANLKIRKIHALRFVLVNDNKVEDVTFTETPKYIGAEEVLLLNEQDEFENMSKEFVQENEKLATYENLIQKQSELNIIENN